MYILYIHTQVSTRSNIVFPEDTQRGKSRDPYSLQGSSPVSWVTTEGPSAQRDHKVRSPPGRSGRRAMAGHVLGGRPGEVGGLIQGSTSIFY